MPLLVKNGLDWISRLSNVQYITPCR